MHHSLRYLMLMLVALVVGCQRGFAGVEHLLPRPQQVLTCSALPSPDGGDTWQEGELTIVMVDSIPGAVEPRLEGFESEAYRLTVVHGRITIEAVTRLGVIRAQQTLRQLRETDGDESLPEGLCITDWPAFKVRGFMHDVGRSFISFEELKKEILLLSQYKINVFQWHMTENQAWRFEVRAFPQLTANENMTRFPGCYYTQEQCRELDSLAFANGVYIIPEIDMPGHSKAFSRAMGHDMQTREGIRELKTVLDEVMECFPHAPYIHLGGDEQDIIDVDGENFLVQMSRYVHSKGRRVMWWNPTHNVKVSRDNGCDMAQCWSTAGRPISGLPCIDCRYNYTNHFDVFADLAGIYRSNILYKQHGDDDTAGLITCAWNDRKMATEEDIISQNNVYAVAMACGERGWIGGGKQYIEEGGAYIPNSGSEYEEFADWERRFLFHKSHSLKDQPIPYVKQTDMRWYISDPVDNGGDAFMALPWDELKDADVEMPDSMEYNGRKYGWTLATGAGIYLNHTWGGVVPGIWGVNQQKNRTAYACTYIYSEEEKTVRVQIETQNYGRSERDTPPLPGTWDYKGTQVWVNGESIASPFSNSVEGTIDYETELTNENFPGREAVQVKLRKGRNKVLLKLPYVEVPREKVRLNKWMFCFFIEP